MDWTLGYLEVQYRGLDRAQSIERMEKEPKEPLVLEVTCIAHGVLGIVTDWDKADKTIEDHKQKIQCTAITQTRLIHATKQT